MAELGIIGAMESEVILLRDEMTDVEVFEYAKGTYYKGNLLGVPVVLARSGVGKVNAAMCAQIMIDRFQVKRLINIGVAGGLVEGMHVGDVVVSTAVMHHDVDPVVFETEKVLDTSLEKNKLPGFFEADTWLVENVLTSCENASGAYEFRKIYMGPIASGDWFISDSDTKEKIHKKHKALCAEMEGAAIGQVAYANDIPFVVVRSISDLADEEADVSFADFQEEIAHKAANVVKDIIKDIKKL